MIALATIAHLYADDSDVEAALRYVEPAYPVALSTHDQPIIAMVGVAVAAVAADLGYARHGATVLGACAVLRGGDDPTEPMQQRVVDRLRPQLGEDLDAFLAKGKALSHRDAQAVVDPALLAGMQPDSPG